MKKWVITGILVLAGSGAAAAMSADSGNDDEIRTSDLQTQSEGTVQEIQQAVIKQEDNDEPDQSESGNDPQTGITPEEAVDIARGIVDGQLEEIELDTEDGRLIYEVELSAYGEDFEIDVDARTGEVMDLDDDLRHFQHDKDRTGPQEGAQISPAEAKLIALDVIGDGYVDDIELEFENGRLVYEVEVESDDDDIDVYVDAYSGEILYIDR